MEIEDGDGIFKFKEWSTHTCTCILLIHKQAKEGVREEDEAECASAIIIMYAR